MSALMIINPAAGQGQQTERILAAAHDREVRVHTTQNAEDPPRLAEWAARAGHDPLIVAGGDGTVSGVINGMDAARRSTRLLIVPLGTGNDFARTLDLPSDPLEALNLLDHGREERVDLVRVDPGEGQPSRLILNAATGGFSEHVHDCLTPARKQFWGPLAYLRAAVDAVPQAVDHDVSLTLDTGERIEHRTPAIVIANGRFAGGGVELAPEANLDDHRLDVLVVTAASFFERMRVAGHVARGASLEAEGMAFRRCHSVLLEADPAMAFSSDGDLIGCTPLVFRVADEPLRVIIARDATLNRTDHEA